MATHTRIVLAQLNLTVGSMQSNAEKMIAAIHRAKNELNADLIIFPELAISGYPPEDLLFRPLFFTQVNDALTQIKQATKEIDVLVGYPKATELGIFNAAAWIRNGEVIADYYKQKLPNQGVFDEHRYFTPGDMPAVVELNGIKYGITICEDIWYKSTAAQATQAGADMIISINASPYSYIKTDIRYNVLQEQALTHKVPIFYCNLLGGQDELVFDGDSVAMNAEGEMCAHAGYFHENLLLVEIDSNKNVIKQKLPQKPTTLESIYQALIMGTKDFVEKNRFERVFVGLSGGIDSALTLTVAVDALGPEKVTAVLMPSQYTAKISNTDAIALAKNLHVETITLPIKRTFRSFLKTLKHSFKGYTPNIAEENIQSRIRNTLLMALTNKLGGIVLTTSNKSELAVGYSTIYGDMSGAYGVIKDVLKTQVYALAEYRNTLSPVIPQRTITRPPSAELAPNQIDQNTLPPYDKLDEMLKMFVEEDRSIEEIVAKGFDEETVKKVIRMILYSEFKRRQAPIGVRISEKAFGRDRRYPITSGYLKRNL